MVMMVMKPVWLAVAAGRSPDAGGGGRQEKIQKSGGRKIINKFRAKSTIIGPQK